MEQPVLGITLLIICSTVCYLSWHQFRNGRYFTAIALLTGCGILLRLFVSAEFFLHAWDERYHALVAKNLIQHPLLPTLYDNPDLPHDYREWSASHVWLHKQPLPLWAMAWSMFLFGVNEMALRLPSVLLTTIGIGLTYQIGYLLFSRKVGFIAAFLYTIHGLILEATGGRVTTDHIDVFFLFWVELAVFFAIKFAFEKRQGFNVLCGLSIGAAILSKWLPALVMLPIWLLLVHGSRKYTLQETGRHFGILCATVILVVLPWQWYIYHTFPIEAHWENSFNWRHITEVLEGHSGPFYYHFDRMRIVYGELIYVPVAWFFWKTFKSGRHYKRWAPAIWVLFPFLFFSFVKTKMQGYTLFTAPALFIITAVFWQYLYTYRHRFKYKIPVWLTLFLLIALPVRYTLERLNPFQPIAGRPAWVAELKRLEAAHQNRPVVLFNVDYPVEAMFYADLTAYSGIPDADLANRLIGKGYAVLVNDKGDLDGKLNGINGVEIIKLTNH